MPTSPIGWLGLPMVSGWPVLIIFVCAVLLLLFLIIKVKLNPFLAMLLTGLGIGFAANMPISASKYVVDGVEKSQNGIVSTLTGGFGSTLTGVGIVIALGVIFGNVLTEAGATEAIAKGLLRLTGKKRATLAVALAGFLISIPVYMDAAFIIMMPIVKYVAKETNRSIMPFVCALGCGTIVGHAMVIPTPGPMAVAEQMGANVGGFIMYALIAGVIAVGIGGWLYGKVFNKRPSYAEEHPEENVEEVSLEAGSHVPGFGLSICALLFPIILILVANIIQNIIKGVEGLEWLYQTCAFIGDKNVALLCGVFVALAMCKRFINKKFADIVVEAADASGLILLVTGAGGAFGAMINACGIGTTLVDIMGNLGIPMVVLAFILSAVLRVSQGSTTVALLTTAGILGPALQAATEAGTLPALGGSPVLIGLAICAGGIGFSMPNDSGFWVLSRFSGISVPDTLKTWTASGTIASFVSFGVILILSIISQWVPLPLI